MLLNSHREHSCNIYSVITFETSVPDAPGKLSSMLFTGHVKHHHAHETIVYQGDILQYHGSTSCAWWAAGITSNSKYRSHHQLSSSGVIPQTVSYTTGCFSQPLQAAFIIGNFYNYVLVLNHANHETVSTSNSPPSSAPKRHLLKLEQNRLKESLICALSQLQL